MTCPCHDPLVFGHWCHAYRVTHGPVCRCELCLTRAAYARARAALAPP